MNLKPVELGAALLLWDSHQLSAAAAPKCLAHQLPAFYSGFCFCVLWSYAFQGMKTHRNVSGVAVETEKHCQKG